MGYQRVAEDARYNIAKAMLKHTTRVAVLKDTTTRASSWRFSKSRSIQVYAEVPVWFDGVRWHRPKINGPSAKTLRRGPPTQWGVFSRWGLLGGSVTGSPDSTFAGTFGSMCPDRFERCLRSVNK